MSIENTDTFGNYLIHGIDEIILPDAVSLWPTASGWKILGVIVLAWFFYRMVCLGKHWWRNRYRREALRQLDKIQQQAKNSLNAVVSALPHYIKVTALQAYPRHEVASLSGNEWLAFLDAHYDGASFSEGIGKKLLVIAYLPETQWQLNESESKALIYQSRQWIKKHKVVSDV